MFRTSPEKIRMESGKPLMKIDIFVIDKKGRKEMYDPLLSHYIKLSRPWAKVQVHEIFGREIAKAQEISADAARRSYSAVMAGYMDGGYNIALDPSADEVDSLEFADLLRDRSSINFFIGGAYGFERDFLQQSNKSVSFGKITLSHKLVKVVLMEQIFRGLSIINNHPYHK
jgi:23S rRNA (pseudouridine1915-N3)-methyltransferase